MIGIIFKPFKFIISPLYKILSRPSIRYSFFFSVANLLIEYSHRERILKQAMEFVRTNKLEGDYLEFGVYIGGTFIPAYHFSKKILNNTMRFFAFDSFQGLPEPKGIDAEVKEFEKGEYAFSLDEFKSILKKNQVKFDDVVFVSGWYSETLNEETKRNLNIKKAAIIYIDCDLYESTVPVLDFVTDYLQDGTIIIFDDWFHFKGNPDRGEQRAFSEWLQKHPEIRISEFHKFGGYLNSFIIHKKEN